MVLDFRFNHITPSLLVFPFGIETAKNLAGRSMSIFLVISLILASRLPVFTPSCIPYLPLGMACYLFRLLPDSNILNLPKQIYLRLFFEYDESQTDLMPYDPRDGAKSGAKAQGQARKSIA
jgi:hypothetical protein